MAEKRTDTHGAAAGGEIIFCHVNPMRGVSGGDVYNARLQSLASEMPDVEVHEYVLLPAHERVASLRKKFLVPLMLPFRHPFRGGERGGRAWMFNSAKSLWFLPLALALRMRGERMAAVVHHPMHLQFGGLKGKIYETAEYAFLRLMDRIVVPSPYVAGLLEGRGLADRISFLPIPFDSTGNRREETHGKEDVYEGGCRIVSIATLERRKGQMNLLRAMKMLKDSGFEISATLVGKEVERTYAIELRRYAETEGLDVTFAGYVESGEKQRIMEKGNVFVSASQAEGYGMAVVEAMLAGLPVVAFRNTSMPMLLNRGERGVLCRDGDPGALADGIRRVTEDRDLRRLVTGRARAFAASLPDSGMFSRRWQEIVKKEIF